MSSMTLPAPTPTTDRTTGQATHLSSDWVAGARRAACAEDPEVMFPLTEAERPGQRTKGERVALAVCTSCPVLAACRRAVLDTLDTAPMPYGVAGGLTREDRRVIRAHRRDLTTDPARPASGSASGLGSALAARLAVAAVETAAWRDVGLVVVDELDEQVHTAITAHPQVAGVVDPATVRGLIGGDGPAWASRWEVALAAVVLLARGHTATAAARALGEEYVQVKRWRDRIESGEALVAGERGTVQLRRPARLIGPQAPAAPRPGREARTWGAA